MKNKKGLLGGIVLILIGLGLVFPPFFSILSKYVLVVIGLYLIFLGYMKVVSQNSDKN